MRISDYYINLRMRGWSIKDIAKMMGVSYYIASKYEARYQGLVN